MSKAALKQARLKQAQSDPVWEEIREEARRFAAREAQAARFLQEAILRHDRFEEAWVAILAEALAGGGFSSGELRESFAALLRETPALAEEARADIAAIRDRDPACLHWLAPLLYFKGFHALSTHRFAHALWAGGGRILPLHLQSRVSAIWGVDIHPAAQIGSGVMIDHATGVVIGETAVVEDDVSMLHGVTLGGTGREAGGRHPKIRRGVLIGAGACILGNIEIGARALIGAGSVVLEPIPAGATAVGIPARVISPPARRREPAPARAMEHRIPPSGKD